MDPSKVIALVAFCIGICCVWAHKHGSECIEVGHDDEPLLEKKDDFNQEYEDVVAEVKDQLLRQGINCTEMQRDMFATGIYRFVVKKKFEAYEQGAEHASKKLGFVCPPPIEKCPNDTDGDGNCHYCLDNPKGCLYKK